MVTSINDIISKNKLVFAFILGLLTCCLIFNCGSCKEGYGDWFDCMDNGQTEKYCTANYGYPFNFDLRKGIL